jgi:RNA polymerase sigma-70 factor, ECF subfamily
MPERLLHKRLSAGPWRLLQEMTHRIANEHKFTASMLPPATAKTSNLEAMIVIGSAADGVQRFAGAWTCAAGDGLARGPRKRTIQTFISGCVGQPGPRSVARENATLARHELAEAIAKTSRGDRLAFERVYAATSAKLYGIIFRIVGRRDVADDVLRETFLRVWQRATEFDPNVGAPITWLATIARNRALNEVRRKVMRSLDDCPEVLQLPNGDNPLSDHEEEEERRRLEACLIRLGAEKRDIVLQVYYYGMTREEIAKRISRPVSTVKTWLRRSLAELKGYLNE